MNEQESIPAVSFRVVRLTKREMEVLRLVAEGQTSKEVADALYVSKRTVDFHLSQVYEKLAVKNRVEAIRAAVRLGLMPDTGFGGLPSSPPNWKDLEDAELPKPLRATAR